MLAFDLARKRANNSLSNSGEPTPPRGLPGESITRWIHLLLTTNDTNRLTA